MFRIITSYYQCCIPCHIHFFKNRLANLSLRHPDPQPQMIHGDLKIGLWFCSVLFPLAFLGVHIISVTPQFLLGQELTLDAPVADEF